MNSLPTNIRSEHQLAAFSLTDGTLEALKWLALISMTIDHANRYFYQGLIYPAYCIGRLAMPLFAFILAYNLAKPASFSRGVYQRVQKKLIIFGLLATPAYFIMKGSYYWLPLNIMFTLWLATTILYRLELKGTMNTFLAFLLFALGGIFVEYSWPGLAFSIAVWFFCKQKSFLTFFLMALSLFLIGGLNNNQWAMLALPLVIIVNQMDVPIPRIRNFFYAYYPFHLTFFYFLTLSN